MLLIVEGHLHGFMMRTVAVTVRGHHLLFIVYGNIFGRQEEYSFALQDPLFRGHMTGMGYRDEVVSPLVIPFHTIIGPGVIFQDGNARPHSEGLSDNALAKIFH